MTKILRSCIYAMLLLAFINNVYADDKLADISNATATQNQITDTTPAPYSVIVERTRFTKKAAWFNAWEAKCNWVHHADLSDLCSNDLALNGKSGDKHVFFVEEEFIGDAQNLHLEGSKPELTSAQTTSNAIGTAVTLGILWATRGVTTINTNPYFPEDVITYEDIKNAPPNPKKAILTEVYVTMPASNVVLVHKREQLTLVYTDMSNDELRKIHYQNAIKQEFRME
ncbi:hypothetical protein [Sulfuriferula nivalis]|uniref:Uncharacterized protein n=1 Tax=Sulfuriferula nivalis TaxID=2675298 RepID=A0A809RC36_9PROT|nr:hypothetical protein [Sulfuriferula nivalis]BBO99308.1 hypothetical protein SFSGTM_00170 [Sulfuriferula nivalis]